MADPVPDRIARAVSALALRGDERVLELGCGPGVGVEEVGRLLVDGHVTAIDRSAVAVARASRRNADLVSAGTADVRHLAVEELLSDAAGLDAGSFDVVFAVNVNLFWTRDAVAELEALRSLLRPGSWLRLFYGAPDSARTDRICAHVSAAMTHAGLVDVMNDRPAPLFVGVSGRRGG